MSGMSFKIFITKQENFEKIITLDEAFTLDSCSNITIKSVSIFWDYNNLEEKYFYNYDIDSANKKVSFKEGYYTFHNLKTEFENVGNIELEQVSYSGKCKIRSDKKINLKTLGPKR